MTEPKLYRYYGIQYTQSVGVMAQLANVSIRTVKDSLKLHSMGGLVSKALLVPKNRTLFQNSSSLRPLRSGSG